MVYLIRDKKAVVRDCVVMYSENGQFHFVPVFGYEIEVDASTKDSGVVVVVTP